MTRPIALVLRALGLGDFFTGLPALALLRAALPDHHVVLAAPRIYAPLATLSGSVDEVVAGHELAPLTDAPRHPELAVDLHGNGPASRQLLLDRDPARLVASNWHGVHWRADEHEVTRWCRLVVEGLELPATTRHPSVVGALPVPDGVAVPSGLTLLHVGAKSGARRWPAQRFVEVAIVLRNAGHDVAITAGTDEVALANGIASSADVPVMDGLSLPQLCALIAHARLLVCGDTGVAHVATNYATPSVVLFGPVPPDVWGPPRTSRHQVLWHGTGDGNPHGRQPDPALLKITVSEVLAAIERAEQAASGFQWFRRGNAEEVPQSSAR
ncbi:MAG TPA: glycosyltransferase family 9 protein [Jatrophihabitans sp.]|nr:glycosyltransferase family 9 protein [Jatrophihabitans sp.]